MNWFFKKSVSEKWVDEVKTYIQENPSQKQFNHIFGNKERIVVPLVDSKLSKTKKLLEEKGYEVDLKNGYVYRVVKQRDGSDKKVQYRFGKIVQKEFGEKYLVDLNKKELDKNTSEYSVVLSRNPVDVLRMSDFSALHSCHAEGDSYFHCAVAEAKNGGAIAFLVKGSELKKLEEEDFSKEEILSDDSRGTGKIIPSGRIRIRRLVNKDGWDLAIPEGRVYGNKVDGYKEKVMEYLREKQLDYVKEKTGGKRPSLKDFKLYGGSYQDSSMHNLVNSFFDDKEDTYSNIEVVGDENKSIIETFTNELDSFKEYFSDILKYSNVNYELNDDEGGVLIYCFFDITIPFNTGLILQEGIKPISNFIKELSIAEIEGQWGQDITIDNVYVENGKFVIHGTSTLDSPDYFEVICKSIEDFEDNIVDHLKNIKETAVENEWIKDFTKSFNDFQKIDDGEPPHNFKNIDVSIFEQFIKLRFKISHVNADKVLQAIEWTKLAPNEQEAKQKAHVILSQESDKIKKNCKFWVREFLVNVFNEQIKEHFDFAKEYIEKERQIIDTIPNFCEVTTKYDTQNWASIQGSLGSFSTAITVKIPFYTDDHIYLLIMDMLKKLDENSSRFYQFIESKIINEIKIDINNYVK